MAEDEAHRLLRGQEPLLVAHDQVVGVDVRRAVAARVLDPLLVVDAEVAAVHELDRREAQGLVSRLGGEFGVGLLKPPADAAEPGTAVILGVPVVRDSIEEEQGEHLDSQRSECPLLVEVLANGLHDLRPLSLLVERRRRLRHGDLRAVGELDRLRP